jgi:hypothetical protein
MKVLSWIVFIGLLIEAGARLISYSICMYNPEAAREFYKGSDLYELRITETIQFTLFVFNGIILSVMKSYAAFLVIQLLTKINLKQPFELRIAFLLEKLSFYIFAIWVVSVIFNQYNHFLTRKFRVELSSNSLEFIFLAGVIFIIAQIFKRGIEIQTENDLTI